MPPAPSLPLAERVVAAATELQISTALIGAAALAFHGYVRATNDLDLGVSVSSLDKLQLLDQRLAALGLHTRLQLPDDQDVLGGVLRVWEHEDDEGEPLDLVEIVNFYNPLRPRRGPGTSAIQRATPITPGSPIRCVGLADLIALKLAAGSLSDKADVVRLVELHPDADAAEIRATCAQYGLGARFDELIDPEP